ncbi:MAG: hypothetical protein JKX68_12990 [Flavobacteriales bacterium]|nr:hypothetical protein [Flavobacteriales bacterium]
MNNQGILSPSNSRSWVIIFVILMGLMLTTVTINAQSINGKVAFNDDEVNDYVVKYFKVKKVNNKLYFKFLVLENRSNANYTLESSANGTDFSAVKLKQGFKSPNGVPLLYCYSVDLNNLNDTTYRIRRDSPDGINYSSIIEMDNSPNLSAQNY